MYNFKDDYQSKTRFRMKLKVNHRTVCMQCSDETLSAAGSDETLSTVRCKKNGVHTLCQVLTESHQYQRKFQVEGGMSAEKTKDMDNTFFITVLCQSNCCWCYFVQ